MCFGFGIFRAFFLVFCFSVVFILQAEIVVAKAWQSPTTSATFFFQNRSNGWMRIFWTADESAAPQVNKMFVLRHHDAKPWFVAAVFRRCAMTVTTSPCWSPASESSFSEAKQIWPKSMHEIGMNLAFLSWDESNIDDATNPRKENHQSYKHARGRKAT